ncbi:MAG: alkaline phosphatase [Bacteroidaceae bacterium]|nr:alkaline phosphatase [Bacteroidaceae bacterium]
MKKLVLFIALLLPVAVAEAKQKASKKAPKHIIIVGFDGMSAQSIREADAMPFYESMMKKGAYTLTRRSVLPSSSACNWASLYMAAGPEQHGYNKWNSRTPDFPSDTLTRHGFFPDIYFLIKENMPGAKIGHFYEWDGMHYVVDTLSVDRDFHFDHNNEAQMQSVIDYVVKEKPTMVSIVFDNPDHAGHSIGWMTPEYLAAETEMDGALSRIYKAVEQQPGMLEETLFVLTADHGGKGKSHGGTSLEELETCLVFCGKGIQPGTVITETSNVTDVAATLAVILGLPRPHAWIGRPLPSIVGRKKK